MNRAYFLILSRILNSSLNESFAKTKKKSMYDEFSLLFFGCEVSSECLMLGIGDLVMLGSGIW